MHIIFSFWQFQFDFWCHSHWSLHYSCCNINDIMYNSISRYGDVCNIISGTIYPAYNSEQSEAIIAYVSYRYQPNDQTKLESIEGENFCELDFVDCFLV